MSVRDPAFWARHAVERLARFYRTRWLVTLDLEAAFDETGDDDNSPVIGMAGYLSDADYWREFAAEWSPVPEEFGVSKLHTTDCENAQKEFLGWDRDRKNAFYARLIPLIDKYATISIGVTMDRADYDRIVPEYIKHAIVKPYFFCQLQCAVKLLAQYPNGLGDGERLAFIFDCKKRAMDYATRNFRIIRELLGPQSRWLAGPAYEDDECYLPLQAADFVAWRMARRRKIQIGAAKAFPGWQATLYLAEGHLKPLHEHLTPEKLERLVELVKNGPF